MSGEGLDRQVRSLERALADLITKYNRTPETDPARLTLRRMISRLTAEIAVRSAGG